MKTEFSHRSRRKIVARSPSPCHTDQASDEEDEASQNLTEEDSNLRISSLLMSRSNVDVETAHDSMEKHHKYSKDHDDDQDEHVYDNAERKFHKKDSGSNRADIIKSVESRAVRRADACTMRMGDIIDHLQKALEFARSYDQLNVLHEMEQWKKRAMDAEKKQEEMAQEIQTLKKEVTTWENRTRRAEKRCERLQNGDQDKDASFRSLYNHNCDSSNASEISITKSGTEIKALIQGKSFRNKWDRKRIAGIEEEIHLMSDGESTVAAREYINQFIESSSKRMIIQDETRDDSLNLNQKERATQGISIGNHPVANGRTRRNAKTHHMALPPQQSVSQSLETQENDNSWVEMLSI